MQTTTARRLGALYAALAVAAGAFAAHSLKLPTADAANWETGARYQMYHALALVLCSLLGDRGIPVRAANWCFAIGTPIFSTTLYAMALGGPRWLGAITPLGGTLMIVGWLCLLFGSARTDAST